MTLIFSELEYAEELLKNGPKSKTPKTNDLFILGRYYKYLGLKPSQIRDNVEEFWKKYFPGFNEVLNGGTLDKIKKNSGKQKLRIGQSVFVTKSELERIRSVNNNRLEKILFTMLVMSRYYRLEKEKNPEGYYVNQNFSIILSLAHVYAEKSERDRMKHELAKLRLIEAVPPGGKFKSNGKDNFRLFYFDEDSEKTIWVTNMKKISDFYPFYCEVCGKITEKKSNRQKMCEECFAEKDRERKRNWWNETH